jgi:sulfite exporter TauE/SafE
MMNRAELIDAATVLAGIVWVTGIASAILSIRFNRLMRSKYPDAWSGLKQPAHWWERSMGSDLRMIRYFTIGAGYRSLGDAQLTKIGDIARWLYFAMVAALIAAALIIIPSSQ